MTERLSGGGDEVPDDPPEGSFTDEFFAYFSDVANGRAEEPDPSEDETWHTAFYNPPAEYPPVVPSLDIPGLDDLTPMDLIDLDEELFHLLWPSTTVPTPRKGD